MSGPTGLIGYSKVIDDPAFKKYLKQANTYALGFSFFIAFVALVGFFIAGEMEVEGMSNPESLYIGAGIGGMFIVIALFQVAGRKRSKTWDGKVVDKQIAHKKRRVNQSDDITYVKEYTLYKVVIEDQRGKRHEILSEDDDTLYHYYHLGDHVRHHGGLNTYEKYDKSKDKIIFCASCASLCVIEDSYCHRCKCPLLK